MVIHPLSYVDGPSATFSGDARAQVLALLDHTDSIGVSSRTMSAIRNADGDGNGVACKNAR